tara:strand:+ start:96 stop:779 length:684 start_codon:yes stop_codon:yes gene_type:complete
MEEYIGYGLVTLLLTSLVFLFKKIFKRNNSSLSNGDEIILDSDMVHYGPFSGNPGQKHFRKFVFLLSISSSFLVADIEIQTMDNWGISSIGNELLYLEKHSEDVRSTLFISMERPFCICANPLLTAPIGNSSYNPGDKIEATMIVDQLKPKKIHFYVDTIFENGNYLLRPVNYPPLRYAEIIRVKFASNVNLEDILFNTKGMSNAMNQSERICFSNYMLGEMQDTKV